MDRRTFLAGAAGLAAAAPFAHAAMSPLQLYVSPTGEDEAAGSIHHPVRTLQRALALARQHRSHKLEAVSISLRAGTYELSAPLKLLSADSANPDTPLTIQAYAGETVVLSGGTRLSLDWKPYRGQIQQAKLPPGTTTDQLFVNGRRQILARYPNFDPNARYLNGTAEDALSLERLAQWAHPEGGYIHAMQQSLWGSLHYRIDGKNADGSLRYEGGWQIDRDQPRHKKLLFVEGIFEELDSPGEWFLDEHTSTLYLYPPSGTDLRDATVEVVRLDHLIQMGERAAEAVRGIKLRGLTFRHTLRTFMQTREPILRSDWRIYRGGAVLLENTEDITFDQCTFDQPGGNAVFASGYSHRLAIIRCHITEAGGSGLCFVGRAEAVRAGLEGYEHTQSLAGLDLTPGPKGNEFPADCLVEDCLIEHTGRFEKQSAPVEIDIAQRITVRHCSMYGVPRAAVNIGDGAWGGHRIESCDAFDTVLETSDHGAFNSWGRDRWWHLKDLSEDAIRTSPATEALPTLDAMQPTSLIANRWACEHGWDIDLDDGSTNYRIERNLCLCGGIKLREGFDRVVENNVMVNNTLHVHVWPSHSSDIVQHNIVFVPYRPVRPKAWGTSFDDNLLHRPGMSPARAAAALQQLSGQDAHSLEGDALFSGAYRGDFSLQENSPARRLGIQSLGATQYGVRSPYLRARAKSPDIQRLLHTEPATLKVTRRKDTILWMGANVRNLVGLGEMSELGAPTERGVVVTEIPAASPIHEAGMHSNDLLVEADGAEIADTSQLAKLTSSWASGKHVQLHILRKQHPLQLVLTVPALP